MNDSGDEFDPYYAQAVIDTDADPEILNSYEPPSIKESSSIPLINDPCQCRPQKLEDWQ